MTVWLCDQAEAARKEALKQREAQIEYARQQVEGGIKKLKGVDADARLNALKLLEKLLNNIVTSPNEEKFQKIRLTNAKIAAVIVELDGPRDVLFGAGFNLEGEFMVFSDQHDKSRNALNGALAAVRNEKYEIEGRPPSDEVIEKMVGSILTNAVVVELKRMADLLTHEDKHVRRFAMRELEKAVKQQGLKVNEYIYTTLVHGLGKERTVALLGALEVTVSTAPPRLSGRPAPSSGPL